MKMRGTWVGILVVAGMAATPALAQDMRSASEKVVACQDVADPAERLTCFETAAAELSAPPGGAGSGGPGACTDNGASTNRRTEHVRDSIGPASGSRASAFSRGCADPTSRRRYARSA